jgi:hypothetical protein
MGSLTRTQRVRRMLLGICLIVGPVLIASNEFLGPDVDWDSSEAVMSAAAANPGMWQITGLLGFFGFAMLVPVAIAGADLIRRRHPALALASTVMMSVGGIIISAVIIADMTLAAVTTAEVAAMAAWHDRIDSLPGVIALFPLFFMLVFGVLALATGLFRTRATMAWVPALMAVSIVTVFFADGGTLPSRMAEIGMVLSFWGVAYSHFTQQPEETLVIPDTLATAPPTPAV